MLFYFVIIVISSLFAWIANTQKHQSTLVTKVFYVISALIMFVPLAMRDVGIDYGNYVKVYLSTATNWNHYWNNYTGFPEPLYVVLNYLARWIFNSYQGVNFLCATLSIGFTFASIYRFKDKINLGITIWCFGFLYYIMMYGLNRMMIAVSIITWAWQDYFSKKRTKYILWSVIAGLFHYSAFLTILLYFISRWMDKRNISITGIKWVKAVASVFAILIIIYKVTPYVFGSFIWFSRYRLYFGLSFTLSALNNNAATYFLIVLIIIYQRKLKRSLEEYKSIITTIVLYVELSLACTIMPIHRITFYFFPICILLYGAIPVSAIFSKKDKAQLRISNFIYLIIIIIMGTLWIYYFLNGNLWRPFLVPYKWGSF